MFSFFVLCNGFIKFNFWLIFLTWRIYLKVTLILENLPQECDGNNVQTGGEHDMGTPSESSEAESSTDSSVAEDEEVAWESGWYNLRRFSLAWYKVKLCVVACSST